MADLPTPHDTLFRALLSDPGRVRDFLRDHLPNDIAGRLADSLPELVEGSFVDEALASSQSDLLLKVELASGGPAFIYLLAEHQCRIRHWCSNAAGILMPRFPCEPLAAFGFRDRKARH